MQDFPIVVEYFKVFLLKKFFNSPTSDCCDLCLFSRQLDHGSEFPVSHDVGTNSSSLPLWLLPF